MTIYIVLKWLHILSSTILFGTGIGIAFFKWSADRSRNLNLISGVNELTVWADWIFTTPAVIIQPLTGFAMIFLAGYPLNTPWIMLATSLYLVAGCCWLPVLRLQIEMRTLSRTAMIENSHLPDNYWRYARTWFWLGVPAFLSLVTVFWLMVSKPIG